MFRPTQLLLSIDIRYPSPSHSVVLLPNLAHLFVLSRVTWRPLKINPSLNPDFSFLVPVGCRIRPTSSSRRNYTREIRLPYGTFERHVSCLPRSCFGNTSMYCSSYLVYILPPSPLLPSLLRRAPVSSSRLAHVSCFSFLRMVPMCIRSRVVRLLIHTSDPHVTLARPARYSRGRSTTPS